MSESNIAQDQLQAYVRRIESVEDELAALNSDKSEIYKEARSNGFDTKILRKVVSKRRLGAVEREEQDTIFELYWDAVHAAKSEPVRAHVENIEEFPVKSVVSALRADPDLAIVEAAVLEKSKPQPTKAAGQASLGQDFPSSVESEVAAISTFITEPQPPQLAGSDLTSLAPNEGQVAPNSDIANPMSTDTPAASELSSSDPQRSVVATRKGAASEADGQGDDEAAEPVVSQPMYAAPGVVTWESTPPEGVERHAYSNAFGTIGQDAVVIADDIAKASAQPIVKIGNIILDGWARYMAARGAFGLDGQSTEYPVVQYDGKDPLLDCIRWNVAGRILSDKDKQTVVARLIAIEPKRKAEILKAMAELAI